ncbi:MAG: hypothetical protein KJ886_02200 [Candidatus Thermoplasmatota archaeon]|nr:hypothetical protein [Candidatus Thermoplasmatota archaeon]
MAGKKGKTPEYDSERETRVLLENMNKNIGLIAEQHGEIKADIGEIKSRLGNVESELGTVKMAVMENSRKIDRVEKKLDTNIDNHEKRITKIEEKIGI